MQMQAEWHEIYSLKLLITPQLHAHITSISVGVYIITKIYFAINMLDKLLNNIK